LFETLYGLQRILKDLHRRLRCAQLLWTRFVTRKFRVNVLDAEELVIARVNRAWSSSVVNWIVILAM